MDGQSKISEDNTSESKVEKEKLNPIVETRKNENSSKEESEIVQNRNSGKDQRPDADVPEDFFDDFLKEDFMAGLDIVDEDDEDMEETNDTQPNENESKLQVSRKEMKKKGSKEIKKFYKNKVDHVKKTRESPLEEDFRSVSKLNKIVQQLKQREDELRKLDRELEEIRKAPIKRSDKYGPDADNFDIRRDPEKTRHAIQQDKIRTAKDKEKRLITDIVQTGLVPPGMELEVDIEEVRRIEKIEKNNPVPDLQENIHSRKSRSKSYNNGKDSVRKRTSPLRKSATSTKRTRSRTSPVSIEKAHEHKRSFFRNRSPLRQSPELFQSQLSHLSPHSRRTPIMHESPYRHQSPNLTRQSELFEGHLSPSRRNVESPKWSPTRRTRSPHRSPSFRRRSRSRSFTNRQRSPVFRTSRSREHLTSFHRGRDRSHNSLDQGHRRRSHSRSQKKFKKDEKISFLEELVAKLNETHPTQSNMPYILPQMNYLMSNVTPIVAPVPPVVQQSQVSANFFTPAPVPQPSSVQQSMQEYDPYDESFFIGTTAPTPTSGHSHFENEKPEFMNPTHNNGVSRYESNHTMDRDISKLFGDRRIKLSDFLAITAKPQVSNASSGKLQEKIKVIQRCQDAIKVLNERRFAGPLVVYKTNSYKYSKDMTISPLLRKPIIQLSFTTPGVKTSSEVDFTKCCEALLYRVGIQKKLNFVTHEERTDVVLPKEITLKDTPPLTSILKQYSEVPVPFKIASKSLSTQTDKELSSCKECLRRKGILYSNCGIQAGNPMLTFSVSTQVTEADFYSMIPKTQSLASLTPAQLLGKQSMIADLRVNRNVGSQDFMSRVRQIPSPPPPPLFHFSPSQSLPPPPNDSYSHPVYSQSVIPPLMQGRPPIHPNKKFNDERRGVFKKRF